MTILGPCRCQGCGEQVVLVWLHPNGGSTCALDRYCKRCDDWYPDEPAYWYRHGTKGQQCKACAQDRARARLDKSLEGRGEGLHAGRVSNRTEALA